MSGSKYFTCYELYPSRGMIRLSIKREDALKSVVQRRNMQKIDNQELIDRIVQLTAEMLLMKMRIGEAAFLLEKHELNVGLDTEVFANSRAYLVAIRNCT